MTTAGVIYARALAGTPVHVRGEGGRRRLPVHRWTGDATAADDVALSWARGPVLDVGCGPGRHLAALAERGEQALGIDSSAAAVAVARRRGVEVMHGSVLDDVPGAGLWRSALLLDGNIGIGGAPVTLLRRVRALLHDEGEIVVELGPPGVGLRAMDLRLEAHDACSAPFPWAIVGVDAITGLAAQVGMAVAEQCNVRGRWFALLAPACA